MEATTKIAKHGVQLAKRYWPHFLKCPKTQTLVVLLLKEGQNSVDRKLVQDSVQWLYAFASTAFWS